LIEIDLLCIVIRINIRTGRRKRVSDVTVQRPGLDGLRRLHDATVNIMMHCWQQ